MVINWYGLSSFNISSGSFTLITDPFSKKIGLTPIRAQADVAILSNARNPNYNNDESLGGPASTKRPLRPGDGARGEAGEGTFVIDGPGEYDVKDLFVRGTAAKGDKPQDNGIDYTTIYAVVMEDIRLGFLGSLKQKELTNKQLEELGNVDVLLLPVGGGTVCDAEEAVTIVNQIEPRIVVPMHYEQKGLKLKLDKVEHFLKEIGSKPKPEDRLTVKKSDFDGGPTKIVVLEPQRK